MRAIIAAILALTIQTSPADEFWYPDKDTKGHPVHKVLVCHNFCFYPQKGNHYGSKALAQSAANRVAIANAYQIFTLQNSIYAPHRPTFTTSR